MLKVKLINEKTPLKIKMVAKFPSVVLANLQDKVVNPSVNEQIINADFGYDGLNNETINPVTKDIDSDIIPENIKNGVDILGVTGSLEEKKEEEEKSVALDMLSGNQIIMPTENKVLSKVTIEKPSTLISDNIKNGVNIGGVTGNFVGSKYAPRIIKFSNYKGTELDYELANLDTSNITDMDSMFSGSNLKTLVSNSFDTNNNTSLFGFCYNCSDLITFDLKPFDTSKVTSMAQMLYRCYKLTTLKELNCDSVTTMFQTLYGCSGLVDIGGFKNLGKAYSTSQSANKGDYKLDLSSSTKLTEQSIINILNNLYDIATKGVKPQQVILGSTNLAKLTSEEGQQALQTATQRGWNIS